MINTLAEIFTLSLVAINSHSFALPGLCDECCPSGDHPDQGNHSDSALCCTTPPLPCRWQFGNSPPSSYPTGVCDVPLVPSPKASSHHKHNHGVGRIKIHIRSSSGQVNVMTWTGVFLAPRNLLVLPPRCRVSLLRCCPRFLDRRLLRIVASLAAGCWFGQSESTRGFRSRVIPVGNGVRPLRHKAFPPTIDVLG